MPRGITSKKEHAKGGFENWMCSCGYEMTSSDTGRGALLKKLHNKKCSGEKKFTRDEMKVLNLKKTKQKRTEVCGVNLGGAKKIESYGEVDGVEKPTEIYGSLIEYAESVKKLIEPKDYK
jgi:hypothetical protein